ncbi:type IV pilus modification PilV family protein [Tropicibacter oceani]|uniref:Prepilin-type N-terminal cleavage/methylation domain-containing protein n=1 Tax=Tropicibacter oceani TaxID=3058420 RepID=A0ABY8QP58_9RHOB|nr:prepilin-type N-terminal cleavage/methylation domain-containing protein [Tropicibacter oceani]WGW05912.1 prepilin-type N-terminal cleavage/methylation domain-containing protein [Tropicibacter oceani]
MFRRLITRRAARGMTLVELAVAIFVLTIGSIAALRAADQSARVVGGEMPRLLARIAARNRAEELQLLAPFSGGLPGQVRLGDHVFTLTTTTERTAAGLTQTTITARSDSGEGAQLVVYIPRVNPR